MNPPPGSTDPERFATVSIGIGDRVLFHPAPREPRHEWCEVSLRTEAGQFASSDLPWPVRWAIRPPPPSYFADTTQQFQDPSAWPACNADVEKQLAACKALALVPRARPPGRIACGAHYRGVYGFLRHVLIHAMNCQASLGALRARCAAPQLGTASTCGHCVAR